MKTAVEQKLLDRKMEKRMKRLQMIQQDLIKNFICDIKKEEKIYNKKIILNNLR